MFRLTTELLLTKVSKHQAIEDLRPPMRFRMMMLTMVRKCPRLRDRFLIQPPLISRIRRLLDKFLETQAQMKILQQRLLQTKVIHNPPQIITTKL